MMMTQDRRDRINAYQRVFADCTRDRNEYLAKDDMDGAYQVDKMRIFTIRQMTVDGLTVLDLLDVEPPRVV
jgi:hypothetical protein